MTRGLCDELVRLPDMLGCYWCCPRGWTWWKGLASCPLLMPHLQSFLGSIIRLPHGPCIPKPLLLLCPGPPLLSPSSRLCISKGRDVTARRLGRPQHCKGMLHHLLSTNSMFLTTYIDGQLAIRSEEVCPM